MHRNEPDGDDDDNEPNDDIENNARPVTPPIDLNERAAAQIQIRPLPQHSNDRMAIYENAFLGNRPDPQPPRNLRQYLNALTENHEMNQNVVRQVVNNVVDNATAAKITTKPGNNISALPVEVLLVVFSYLDDISLCHVGEVCKQWKNILELHTPQSLWQRYTRTRWPLYHQISQTTNWFKVK